METEAERVGQTRDESWLACNTGDCGHSKQVECDAWLDGWREGTTQTQPNSEPETVIVFRVKSRGHADYLTLSREDAETHNRTEEGGRGIITEEPTRIADLLRHLQEWEP
jgi:hypothetical protein